jgi:hypothetical protein
MGEHRQTILVGIQSKKKDKTDFKLDKIIYITNPPDKMLSTTFPDNKIDTLCEETLAILNKQKQTKIYTQNPDVFWSPDVALEEVKTKTALFGRGGVWDGRVRPDGQIDPDTKTCWTEEKIKEKKDGLVEPMKEARSRSWDNTLTKEQRKNAQELLRDLDMELAKWNGMSNWLMGWKPVRQVLRYIHLNQRDRSKYEETAKKYPDDVFIQQVWSCIRQRCEIMEEANKSRKNPMRNITITVIFTPSQTFFTASWDIHRWSNGYTHETNRTEYSLQPDGQVVQFKSDITLNKEQKEREDAEATERRKREVEAIRERKKAEELASLTHHTDADGHPYSQTGSKKITAFYRNIWRVLPPSEEVCKMWKEEIRVLSKIEKDRYVYVTHFYGVRVDDNPQRSLFALVGWTESFSDKGIKMFPERHMFEVLKGKNGKYKKDMKQLRVCEKMIVSDFPKV